jgi:EmrB/QacA subfamily drug resistance transporter
MAFIDATALNVAMPALQTGLGATGAQLLWILNAYALPLCALLLVAGMLSDRFGRRRVFGLGIATFAVASLVCGFAPDAQILIAARIVQGLGAAMMIPGSLALINSVFPPDRRGRAIGKWSAFSVVMMALGPVLGGVLAHAGLWRLVFFLNIPIAIASLLILLKVPESRNPDASGTTSLWSPLLAMFGLATISYACIEVPQQGLASPKITGLFVLGCCMLVLFVLVEARSRYPILPLHIFRSKTFSGANVLTILLYTAFYAMMFFVPLNLVQVQGYTADKAGLAQLPVMLFVIILSPWVGRIVDCRGSRGPLVFGTAAAGLGMSLFTLPGITSGPADYWTYYLLPFSVLGVGMGLTITALSTTVMSSISSDHAGLASGINSTLSRLASVLAAAILGGVALFTFQQSLADRTSELPAELKTVIMAEADKLGEAKVSQELSGPERGQAEAAINEAFVDTFRTVSWIGAGLAWLGTLVALLFIHYKKELE